MTSTKVRYFSKVFLCTKVHYPTLHLM